MIWNFCLLLGRTWTSLPSYLNVLRSLRFLQLGQLLRLVLQPLAALFRRHELLHPRVAAIDDKDAPLRIDGDSIWKIELSVPVAEPAPLGDEIALPVELFDPMIPRIRHIDISGSVDAKAHGERNCPASCAKELLACPAVELPPHFVNSCGRTLVLVSNFWMR